MGERELQTRIAFICDEPCVLEKRSDAVFFLPGVDAEMTLDLVDRSRNIEGFSIRHDAEGSLVTVSPTRVIEYANAKPCRIDGRQAACADIFFAEAGPREASIETPTLAPNRAAQNSAAPKPVLRESETDRLSRFARLGPPERLTPPRDMPPEGARLASVRPVKAPAIDPSPIMRDAAPVAEVAFDYAASVRALLGKTLSPGFCASSRASLQADPWALEQMVNVGLCEAAAGDAAKAEQMLVRLLEYTPDNYEAHVGRALIAWQAGEKSVARRYFQDALNAPPPLEESNRIVAAMNRL